LKVKKESMKPTHGSQAPSPSQQGEGLKRIAAGLLDSKFKWLQFKIFLFKKSIKMIFFNFLKIIFKISKSK